MQIDKLARLQSPAEGAAACETRLRLRLRYNPSPFLVAIYLNLEYSLCVMANIEFLRRTSFSLPANRPPRVLMFAPAFAPNFFSEALVNSKLALAMLNAGWEVTAFAVASLGVYATGWEDPWDTLRSVRPEIQPTPRAFGTRMFRAFKARHLISGALWAETVARQALRLHKEKPFDLILSRSTSCVAHLPAMLFRANLCGLKKPRWIANWNDPPGHRFPPPYGFGISPLQRLLKDRYLRAAAAGADINSFPSVQLRHYLAKPLGLAPGMGGNGSRNIVIPHIGLGWRPQHVRPSDPRRFRISHAGNLSRERDPMLFLKAFARLADRNPDIQFEFEIIGHLDKAFEDRLAQRGLDRLIVRRGGLSYKACLERLSEADVQILIEAPCKRGVFLPSKLTDYVEVGKPILALSPRIGAVRDLADLYHFGHVAACDSESEIEAALEWVFQEWRTGEVPAERHHGFEMMRDLVSPGRVLAQIWDAAEEAGFISSEQSARSRTFAGRIAEYREYAMGR